jgi:26S proteasome regulatory subunit N12
MATPQMGSLYQELQRVFEARPTDLQKTGKLLTQLKVRTTEEIVQATPH